MRATVRDMINTQDNICKTQSVQSSSPAQSMLRRLHRSIRTTLVVACEHLAKKHGISRCETVLLVTEATIARDVTPFAVASLHHNRGFLPLETRTTTPPPLVYTRRNTYGVWYAKRLFSRDIPRQKLPTKRALGNLFCIFPVIYSNLKYFSICMSS